MTGTARLAHCDGQALHPTSNSSARTAAESAQIGHRGSGESRSARPGGCDLRLVGTRLIVTGVYVLAFAHQQSYSRARDRAFRKARHFDRDRPHGQGYAGPTSLAHRHVGQHLSQEPQHVHPDCAGALSPGLARAEPLVQTASHNATRVWPAHSPYTIQLADQRLGSGACHSCASSGKHKDERRVAGTACAGPGCQRGQILAYLASDR